MKKTLKNAKNFICIFCVIFTVFILIVMFTPMANYAAKPLIAADELKKSDLIIVLGGGAYENGVLGKGSNERLIHGLMLYKKNYAGKIMFSGGTIANTAEKVLHTLRKSEDSSAINVVEAEIMEDISLTLGILKKDIYVDSSSTHTYGNLMAAKNIMEEKGLKECLLVSSPTHMRRVMMVSEKIGLNCHPAPVGDYTWFRKTSVDRFLLAYEIFWEYAALVIYKIYGYI